MVKIVQQFLNNCVLRKKPQNYNIQVEVMSQGLNDRHWNQLIGRIKQKRCIPIIGPNILDGYFPTKKELASTLANELEYPFGNINLAQVAQYVEIQENISYSYELSQKIEHHDKPRFVDPEIPYRILSHLELPIYLTSNYDDFLQQAFQIDRKSPHTITVEWKDELNNIKNFNTAWPDGKNINENQPVIYHLNGFYKWFESLVISENDYLDYLRGFQKSTVPVELQSALSTSSLLILGYDPLDWDFKILMKGILSYIDDVDRLFNLTVQVEPDNNSSTSEAKTFLEKYVKHFDNKMQIYWGSSEQFLSNLYERTKNTDFKSVDAIDKRNLRSLQYDSPNGSQKPDIRELSRKMKEAFNVDELKSLLFELGEEYEDFPSDHQSLTREIVRNFEKKGKLNSLLALLNEFRPEVEW